MSHIYEVRLVNGCTSRAPALIAATKPSIAVRRFMEPRFPSKGSRTDTAPVRLKKGQFVTVSIERRS